MRPLAFDFVQGGSWGTSGPVAPGGVVERVVAGEQGALAELYDAHAPGLRRFARTLLGESAAAEDLVHEVFVVLPRALRAFRGDGELSSFLLSIAANKARNHVRHAMRARAALERARLEAMQSVQSVSPERVLENDQLRLALHRALDALPLKQRLAFVLCDVEGMSGEEAARVLDVPSATIRTRLHHARSHLRVQLKGSRP